MSLRRRFALHPVFHVQSFVYLKNNFGAKIFGYTAPAAATATLKIYANDGDAYGGVGVSAQGGAGYGALYPGVPVWFRRHAGQCPRRGGCFPRLKTI